MLLKVIKEIKYDYNKIVDVGEIVELIKEYGMNIEDDEMSKLYSTYISNSLLSAKSNSSK